MAIHEVPTLLNPEEPHLHYAGPFLTGHNGSWPRVPPSSQPPPFSELKLKTQEPFLMLPSPSPSHSVHLSLIFPTISYEHCLPFRSYRHPPLGLCNHSWLSSSRPPLSHKRSFSDGGLAPPASCPLSFPPASQVDPACVPQHPRSTSCLTCAASPAHFNQQSPCLQFSTSVHADCLSVGAFVPLWCYF